MGLLRLINDGRRIGGGVLDAVTGNRFDLDGLGRPSDNPGNNQEPRARKGAPSRRLRGHPSIMGYPIARGQNERTGDSLLITCREYKASSMNLTGDTAVLRATESKNVDGINYRKNDFILDNKGRYATTKTGMIGVKSLGASDMTHKAKRIYSVELPIPQDVNDANTVTWGDDNMNIFMLAGLTAAGNLGKDTFESAKQLLTQDVDLGGFNALDAETQRAVKAAIAGKAIDVMGGQIRPNSAIGRAAGMILNSNLELLFDSVNLRSFPFSINFSPRTPKESDMVRDIIRAFKSSMAAKKGIDKAGGQGGVFLRAPDVFSLRYLHNGRQHKFLNSFKDCALTGMTVNYTNAGTYTTYDDGTPVSIRMNLTFKELNPIYHEDYIDEIPGVGF